MQLICDALAVLGSRHGVLFNPVQKKCGVIRFDKLDRLPEFELRAGGDHRRPGGAHGSQG